MNNDKSKLSIFDIPMFITRLTYFRYILFFGTLKDVFYISFYSIQL